jgi:hypothetical protein
MIFSDKEKKTSFAKKANRMSVAADTPVGFI